MKHLVYISLAVLMLCGCDERRRMIVPFVPSGNRIVILEEFTGKGCTNCPKGSREIENLLLQFPDNLIVVSIHAGFFANPDFFPLGQYDLRTEEGEFLFDYLGPNLGYPAGVVNRTLVDGNMQTGQNRWGSVIGQQIQTEPEVDLTLNATYNPQTREVSVLMTAIGKDNVPGDIRFSVMLTESGIVDAQDDVEAGGIVPDYVHKHVLRDMMTPAAGASVANSIGLGQLVSQIYTYTIPENWNADQMEVLAFVSAVNGDDFPVLQAASVHLHE